jgi:hypothetical protein
MKPAQASKDIVFFVALFATALALGAALAHALELPNKIALSRDDYFIAQKLYSGWNKLAFLLIIELGSMMALLFLYRRQTSVRRWTGLALLSLFVAQIIFWQFTFPANQSTNNWMIQPENWEVLRLQWEFSHLAGAALQVLAMSFLIIAVLRRQRTM